MKYFKIKTQRNFDNDMIATNACGDRVENGELYFRQLGQGLVLDPSPVFDSFFLESFDKEKYWEWILCDVNKFTGQASRMGGGALFVSPVVKSLFESMNIAKPYKFYPAKLKYKGDKIDRYIYHFFGDQMVEEKMSYLDFLSSYIYSSFDNKQVQIKDIKEYLKVDEEIGEATDYDHELKIKTIVLKEKLDFYYLGYIGCGMIASQRLKDKIESKGVVGFEFSELDFEVEVR